MTSMCYRGVGTATAGPALAAPLSSIKKKKKKKKKNRKKSGETRIGKRTTFLLISHNPFYDNPILTYCTNYGLIFFKALASPLDPHQGLCPFDPRRASHPQTPILAVPLLNSFRRPWCVITITTSNENHNFTFLPDCYSSEVTCNFNRIGPGQYSTGRVW